MSAATRRGLVLGGGGILGAAWMVGALQALQDEIGVDLREFEAFVGTSAGSILAALLGAGVSVTDLVNHQRGGPESGRLAGFHFDYAEAAGGDRPVLSRPGLGSRELLIRNVRQLHQLPPTAVLSAFLPEGRGNLDAVGALISHVVPAGWVARDGVTVVALDYDTGERVAFGMSGARTTPMRDAVMASCAIPGWYQPVRIGDHRFIDGGAWSSTNLDLLAGSGLDEVFVLAPQVSFDADAPTQWATRLERQWRNRVTHRVLREASTVHRQGTEVTILGPGREDLEAIGGNLMDLTRRPRVIETSLRTSAVALRDPDPIPGRKVDRRIDRKTESRIDRKTESKIDSKFDSKTDRTTYEERLLTLTRIYIPLNASVLRKLGTRGSLGTVRGAPFAAHAVTASLEASAPNAGIDDWEFTALDDAAQTSGSMLKRGERRRIVAAADVGSDQVGPPAAAWPADSAVESAVSISGPVALKRIASFHVDDADSEDDAMLWYDVTELPVVLGLL